MELMSQKEQEIIKTREDLGAKLKSIREQNGASTYIVRRRSKLSGAQISAIETGSSAYTIDSLFAYMGAIDSALNVIEVPDESLIRMQEILEKFDVDT